MDGIHGRVSGLSDLLVPGKREAAVFAAFAVLGLLAWTLGTPAITGRLFGEGFYQASFGFPLYSGVPLYALLAFLAGLLFPRGFYLWGVAVVALFPFASVALAAFQRSVGGVGAIPGGIGGTSYAFVILMMAFTFALAGTLLSTAGMGKRLLVDRLC